MVAKVSDSDECLPFLFSFAKEPLPCHCVLKEVPPPVLVFWQSSTIIR